MTADTAAPALAATARNVMDRIRYVVLGTVDEDGCTRTAPEYFVPHRYRDLNWVSTPTSHDSHNRERDDRLSAVPRFERDSVLRLIAAWRCFWTSSATRSAPSLVKR
jgi:hypothetical protein